MLFIDIETRGQEDLKKVGAYRYSLSATPILIMGAEGEDGPVVEMSREQIVNYPGTLCAHNAEFEATCLRIPLRRFVCTAAIARYHGVPGSLKDAGTFLKLKQQKQDTRLLNDYCVRGTRLPQDDRWPEFVEYCRQDVRTCREIWQTLGRVPAMPPGWHTTMQMNLRGIPLDVPAIQSALEILQHQNEALIEECRALTGGLIPSQTARLLSWLKQEGFQHDNLRADTLKAPGSLSRAAERVVEIRRSTAQASTKKLQAMLDMQVQGRAHGTFVYAGAERTARWSGRGLQPQNLKRPPRNSYEVFRRIKAGDRTVTIPEIGGCIRHFIKGPLTAADYSQIEVRVLAWLAGEEKILDAFREGRDIYVEMAQRIFQEEEISPEQRFIGKTAVLGCGYGMGAERFAESAGCDLGVAQKAVQAFRAAFPGIPRLWGLLEEAFMGAPTAGKHITAHGCRRLKLPSGRSVYYWGAEGMTYQDGRWGTRKTWGGHLTENVCQAMAGDVLRDALKRLPTPIMLVHDEIVWEGEVDASPMKQSPEWAPDLPLDIEVSNLPYYGK